MFKFYYTASIVKDANSPDNYHLHFPQSWSCNCDIILLLISLDHNPTCKQTAFHITAICEITCCRHLIIYSWKNTIQWLEQGKSHETVKWKRFSEKDQNYSLLAMLRIHAWSKPLLKQLVVFIFLQIKIKITRKCF